MNRVKIDQAALKKDSVQQAISQDFFQVQTYFMTMNQSAILRLYLR